MAELGRQVQYGIGVESTPGTAVAPTRWLNQLSFELAPRAEYAMNESAYGVIERTNSANVTQRWSEGSFEAKLTSDTAGYVLYGAFGSVSSAEHTDASGNVYNHTFNINQNINGKSFTLVRKDSIGTKAYPNARFGDWSLSMSLGEYITYTANVLAGDSETATATAAYTSEAEFVPKHLSIRTASSVSGLTSASDEGTVESFTLNVNPNIESDFAAGSDTPYSFTSRGYEANFEMTMRYTGTEYEEAYKNGTPLAVRISAVNQDVTIGTSANPGLVFTAPKINITDWTRSEDLDAPVTQSVTGTIHFSAADAYAIRGVLTNTTQSY
jgi:hypothetical protein